MTVQAQNQVKMTQRSLAVFAQSGLLQRKCACGQHTVAGSECEECRQKRLGTLQRAAVSTAPVNDSGKGVPPIVHDVLSSSGQPLDTGTRAFMEPRFGHDFSQVRVHTDAKAAESARAVNALAYTVGRDVVFDEGEYAPGTSEGRRLLAHELTHVVQQSVQPTILGQSLTTGPVDSPLEREADHVANAVGHETASQATENINSTITHTLQPMIQRRVDAHGKECPDTAVIADKKPIPPFDKRMFDAGFRTYFGLVSNMKVGPKDSYDSAITEKLEVDNNKCNMKGNMTHYAPCDEDRHRPAMPIGKTCGGDALTGTTFPCSSTTFVDLHRVNKPFSLLEGTGQTECKVRCLQRYGCGGKEIGRFYITRNFKKGVFSDGTNKVPITVGTIEKEPASK